MAGSSCASYDNNNAVRGVALIINLEYFQPTVIPRPRTGSQLDEERLVETFSQLGFHVHVVSSPQASPSGQDLGKTKEYILQEAKRGKSFLWQLRGVAPSSTWSWEDISNEVSLMTFSTIKWVGVGWALLFHWMVTLMPSHLRVAINI